jgi:hypothetical protein
MLDEFCYIVYRLLEEAKIFKIIFNQDRNEKNINIEEHSAMTFDDKTVVFYDMVTSFAS